MNQILITRPSMPELQEYIDEMAPIWDSRWLTNMGVKHQEFQNELSSYLAVDNVELLTNRHMAIEL